MPPAREWPASCRPIDVQNVYTMSPNRCKGSPRSIHWERVRVPPTSRHPQHIPKPNDNCPLRHRRASLYIDHMRHSHAERPSFPRRREPRIPAALVWMSGPLALWERVRVRVPPVWTPPPTSRQPATTAHCAVAAPAPTNSPPARNATECNQMQLNYRFRRSSPLLKPQAP